MKGIRIDIEFDWDRGPDITITIFAKRTHIIGIYWSAYPVLGGAKPVDNPIHFHQFDTEGAACAVCGISKFEAQHGYTPSDLDPPGPGGFSS